MSKDSIKEQKSDAGADLNNFNEFKEAILQKNFSKAEEVLAESSPDFKDNFTGSSIFHIAIAHGAPLSTIKLMADKGFDIKASPTGLNALHVAAISANSAAIDFLIKNGIDPLSKTEDDNNLLHLVSIQRKLTEFFNSLDSAPEKILSDEILHKLNSMRNIAGETPILTASKMNKEQDLELLAKSGAWVGNTVAGSAANVLILASGNRNIEGTNFALHHNISINITDITGANPLHAALFFETGGAENKLYNQMRNSLYEHINDKEQKRTEQCSKAEQNLYDQCAANVNIRSLINYCNKILPLLNTELSNYDSLNEVVEILLEQGIDPNNEFQNILPLQRVIALGDKDLLDTFLNHEAETNKISTCGTNPMIAALTFNNLYAVTKLLEKGADCFIRDDNSYTLLHHASYNKQNDLLAAALKSNQCDLRALDNEGNTATAILVANGDIEALELFKASGANFSNIDITGKSIVHIAAMTGQKDLLVYAKLNQVDLDSPDQNGSTPLMFAAGLGQLPAIKWLVDENVDLTKTDVQGDGVINAAIESVNYIPSTNDKLSKQDITKIQYEMLDYLLGIFPDIKLLTKSNGQTPLHQAAQNSSKELFALLRNQGLECNKKADDGSTPYSIAKDSGNLEVISYIENNCAGEIAEEMQ